MQHDPLPGTRLLSPGQAMKPLPDSPEDLDFTRGDVQLLRDAANVFNYDITDTGDLLEDLADRLEEYIRRRISESSEPVYSPETEGR